MRFRIKKKRLVDPEAWRKYFALKPTRVNDQTIIWLESVWRRLNTVDEGNWAGGYKYQWIYLADNGQDQWKSQVMRD